MKSLISTTHQEVFSCIVSLFGDPWFSELVENKSSYSVWIYRQLAFNIVFTKSENRIIFKKRFASDLNKYIIPYKWLSSKKEVSFSFFCLDEIRPLSGLFLSIHDSLRKSAPADSFGCCNSFTQCSDSLSCLHPKEFIYLGCMYRENLENGRIFYGKNRNYFPEESSIPSENTQLSFLL